MLPAIGPQRLCESWRALNRRNATQNQTAKLATKKHAAVACDRPPGAVNFNEVSIG